MELYGIVYSLSVLLSTAMAIQVQDIDNGIVGNPEVKCGNDNVEMHLRTRKPFSGKAFVKGHFADPECKIDISMADNAGWANESRMSVKLQHGTCGMQRQRMISPHGMQMSTVVIISFHPIFITVVDRAYNVKCMYREEEHTVSAGLEVSALTTASITATYPMPQCSYTIRKDQIDGEILKYAKVGEQVVHRWECETDAFGILVHSCYVEDGQGERVYVVDENGCHKDRYILGDPTYVEKLNMAYRESHVFKFADRLTVRFKCEIRLCLKFDDGCKGVTPPICSSPVDAGAALLLGNSTGSPNSSFTRAPSNSSRFLYQPRKTWDFAKQRHKRALLDAKEAMPYLINGDFVSQDLYVLESTENPEKDPSNFTAPWNDIAKPPVVQPVGDVCLSLPAFSSLLILVLFVIISAIFSGLYLLFLHICRKQANAIDYYHSSENMQCNLSIPIAMKQCNE